jgi:hypothetical protein
MTKLLKISTNRGTYSGYQISRTKKSVVVHEIRDFAADGYYTFSKLAQVKIKSDTPNSAWHRGLKLLNVRPKLPTIPKKNLTIEGILKYLHRRGGMTMVTFRRKNTDDFFFGRVLSVGRDEFLGRYFSTNGKPLKEPELIPFSAIKEIQWNGRYERVLNRLAKQRD